MFKWGLEGYSVSQPNLLKLQPKTVAVVRETHQGSSMYSRPVSEMRGSALDGVQGAMRLWPACAAAESGADREAPPTPPPHVRAAAGRPHFVSVFRNGLITRTQPGGSLRESNEIPVYARRPQWKPAVADVNTVVVSVLIELLLPDTRRHLPSAQIPTRLPIRSACPEVTVQTDLFLDLALSW